MNSTTVSNLSDSSKSSDANTFPMLNESGVEVLVTVRKSNEDNNEGDGLSCNYQVMTLSDETTIMKAENSEIAFEDTVPDNYNPNDLPDTVSARVELNETYTDPEGNTELQLIYDLVFFRNSDNWYFPVLNATAINALGWSWLRKYYHKSNGTSSGLVREKVMTVYDTDVTAMQQTANFLTQIVAYPSSDMASEYYNALSGNGSASPSASAAGTSSIADLNQAVTDIAAKYNDYKYVDLFTVTTVQSYFDTVPYVHADYEDKKYFYFYSNHSGSTMFIGRLDLIKGTIAPDAKNGGYSITYYPAVNPSDTDKYDVDISKSLDIIYSNGYFYDSAGSRLYLTGSSIKKSIYTKNENDNNTIVPVLNGAIDGYEGCSAVASDFLMTDAADSSEKSTAGYWKNLGTAGQIISVFMMGRLALTILIYGYKGLLSLYSKKGSATSTEDEVNKAANEAAEVQVSGYKKFQSKTGNDADCYDPADDVLDTDVSTNQSYMTDSLTSATNTALVQIVTESGSWILLTGKYVKLARGLA